METLSLLPQVTYIEKPKSLSFAAAAGRAASCINPVQNSSLPGSPGLSGRGVLAACIDSGIDYTHPDFRHPDGTTRILRLWDQTISSGPPPEGYSLGTLYTEEEINRALSAEFPWEQLPSRDTSGHGTAVLGIAAGNGQASGGILKGTAPEAFLAVVKLGDPEPGGFPRTTQLIQALDYIIRLSMELQLPAAINLSFGNSYGSHSGDSLLETYIDSVSGLGRNVICIGTGNEGEGKTHRSGQLLPGQPLDTEFSVGNYTQNTNLQIWKEYVDPVSFLLIHPNGETAGPIPSAPGPFRLRLQNTEVLAYHGMPGPFSTLQEIYLDFLPLSGNAYIDSGAWTLRMIPGEILDGRFHLWLPGGAEASAEFYLPTPDTTLTIPSTSRRSISVAAYNSRLQSYAPFSGRGFTAIRKEIKPDLAAPGTDIQAPRPGGGYGVYSGTSFAVPFVTGSAALLMEWGIAAGNDPYLYGEKVKAYLQRGARQLPGYETWPNPQLGYGALCLKDSFPE